MRIPEQRCVRWMDISFSPSFLFRLFFLHFDQNFLCFRSRDFSESRANGWPEDHPKDFSRIPKTISKFFGIFIPEFSRKSHGFFSMELGFFSWDGKSDKKPPLLKELIFTWERYLEQVGMPGVQVWKPRVETRVGVVVVVALDFRALGPS